MEKITSLTYFLSLGSSDPREKKSWRNNYSAVAHLFCLNLPAAFSQPGNSLIEIPSTSIHGRTPSGVPDLSKYTIQFACRWVGRSIVFSSPSITYDPDIVLKGSAIFLNSRKNGLRRTRLLSEPMRASAQNRKRSCAEECNLSDIFSFGSSRCHFFRPKAEREAFRPISTP